MADNSEVTIHAVGDVGPRRIEYGDPPNHFLLMW